MIEEVKDQQTPETGESRETAEEYVPEPPRALPFMTLLILACIAAVFAAQLYVGLDVSIIRAGFDKPRVMGAHEYWRFFTGFVLHGFGLHILMNGYALYSFGRDFELLSSGAHLANVILVSAIAGNILSLIFLPEGISVGISGGVVGLIGYLAVYSFRRRQFISPAYRKNLLMNIGLILLFGIALFNYIDNYGHIGGLIAGAVYGFFQIPADAYTDPREPGKFAKLTGKLSIAVIAAVSVFSIFKMLS
jgi:rhomboid protease GluP